jgi:hypothetical protein
MTPDLFGYAMIAVGLATAAGGTFVVVSHDIKKSEAVVEAPAAAPKKQRWSIRLSGFAKDFNEKGWGADTKITPTTVRFILQDDRYPEPEGVQGSYQREGDDFIVTTEDPTFMAFIEKHWDNSRMLLSFDHSIEFSPGDVTTGADVIIRQGKNYVEPDKTQH